LGFHLVHGGSLCAFGQSIAHILIFRLPAKSNASGEKQENILGTEGNLVIGKVRFVSNKREYNGIPDHEVFAVRSAESRILDVGRANESKIPVAATLLK
jgi:hypothetical protein